MKRTRRRRRRWRRWRRRKLRRLNAIVMIMFEERSTHWCQPTCTHSIYLFKRTCGTHTHKLPSPRLKCDLIKWIRRQKYQRTTLRSLHDRFHRRDECPCINRSIYYSFKPHAQYESTPVWILLMSQLLAKVIFQSVNMLQVSSRYSMWIDSWKYLFTCKYNISEWFRNPCRVFTKCSAHAVVVAIL